MDEDIHAIFSSIANRYDLLNTVLTLNIDSLWRKKAVQRCEIKANHSVLDLCCGTGKMIAEICKRSDHTVTVVGLDLNHEMLEIAEKRLINARRTHDIRLLEGNILSIPFAESSFDVVTIGFGLRNIADYKRALREIRRVLKPGGRLVCLELSKPEARFFLSIYNVFFNYLLPVIGSIGTGDKGAYRYLRDSVNRFMNKEQLHSALKEAGFMQTGYLSLTQGIASIHFGRKDR
ncbi:MAG: methyltransferase [Oscillospiraceae bacterium]|nr:methyltransferase [Oscillospiraceae bacterium]